MEKQSLDPSFTQIRRKKKEIQDQSWIRQFLIKAPVGVLATIFADQPFLSTKLFLYDEEQHAIYLHSADEGRVFTNVQTNPKVCFTAYEMGRLLPGQRARDFGVEYSSVVVFGRITIIREESEILRVLHELMLKYAPQMQPGKDYPQIEKTELKGMALYRLDIDGWSAKQDLGDPDHPGAYRYEDVIR